MKLERICEVPQEKQHTGEIECVIAKGDKVFTAADDGHIKVWSTENLNLLAEFRAHEYAVNHLLVFQDRLFSASMDGTLKLWRMDSWEPIATFNGHEDTPRKLATDGQFVFSGDDQGNVIKWTRDGELCARYELVEEVWGLVVQQPYICTVRDRGLTVTEIKGTASTSPVVRTVEGRAPIYALGDNLFMLDRSATLVNQFKEAPTCDFVKSFEGHEKIVTTLGGWNDYLISSGYDEKLILWSIAGGKLLNSIPLQGCPTSLCVTDKGDIFVGGPSGSLVKVKILS